MKNNKRSIFDLFLQKNQPRSIPLKYHLALDYKYADSSAGSGRKLISFVVFVPDEQDYRYAELMDMVPLEEFDCGQPKNGHEFLEGITWHDLDSADQECF
jgi:hypothetical protein